MVTTSALRLASPASSSTQASTVYDRVRDDLLSGKLEPGRKLQMRFLTEMYQTGQTPAARGTQSPDRRWPGRMPRTARVLRRGHQSERTGRTDQDPMLGRKPCVAGIHGGLDPAMGRAASAGGASSRQNTSFAQHRTFRRQSGVGTTASRLPQGSHRKLWLSVIDRVLRTTCRPTLQISAPVNPEGLSIQTCGR